MQLMGFQVLIEFAWNTQKPFFFCVFSCVLENVGVNQEEYSRKERKLQ